LKIEITWLNRSKSVVKGLVLDMVIVQRGAWWRFGIVDAFPPEGLGFEFRSIADT